MNFKDLIKDEHSRKVMLLFCYLFVMFVLVLIVRVNPGNTSINNQLVQTQTDIDEVVDTLSGLDKLKYTNYQYEYNITYMEENYILKGTRYNDEEIFDYDGTKYFLKQDTLYEIDGYNMVLVDNNDLLNQIKSEKIYDLISSITPALELDVDGIIEKDYVINTINEDIINIKTYEKDNYINIVEINYETTGVNVVINYSNVNKVLKLNTNFVEE